MSDWNLSQSQRELLDIVTGPDPRDLAASDWGNGRSADAAPDWWADHQKLAMVASYMIDGTEGYDVRDVIYMLEKPWKYDTEYRAAYAWIRAR